MRRRHRGIGQTTNAYGTPTVNPPVPQSIDDYTGFKVPLSSLRKDWQGLLTQVPDIRNPQDFVRGVKDNQALPYSRPEAPNEFVSGPILWESGDFMMAQNDTDVLYTEGLNPTADDL